MPRILLAEDNRLNQLVAVGVLRNLSCEVEIVDDGARAVEACLRDQFDAVLMDIMMPVVDGYEATARIRAGQEAAGLPRTPIIGLSARAMDGDREVALDAGLDDYLTKPLREDQLRASFQTWIPATAEDEVLGPQPAAGALDITVDLTGRGLG